MYFRSVWLATCISVQKCLNLTKLLTSYLEQYRKPTQLAYFRKSWFAWRGSLIRNRKWWCTYPYESYVRRWARAHLEIKKGGNLKFDFSDWCQFRRSSNREQVKGREQVEYTYHCNVGQTRTSSPFCGQSVIIVYLHLWPLLMNILCCRLEHVDWYQESLGTTVILGKRRCLDLVSRSTRIDLSGPKDIFPCLMHVLPL